MDSLKSILGQKHIESFSTIKASELFEKYCDFIEELSVDEYDLTDDVEIEYEDGKHIYLDCEIEFDNYNKVLNLRCNGLNENLIEKCNFEIVINRDNEIRFRPKIDISDYRYLNDFTCYLLMLSNNWVKIEFDITNAEESVLVEFED